MPPFKTAEECLRLAADCRLAAAMRLRSRCFAFPANGRFERLRKRLFPDSWRGASVAAVIEASERSLDPPISGITGSLRLGSPPHSGAHDLGSNPQMEERRAMGM
jgi:hypothetical protein